MKLTEIGCCLAVTLFASNSTAIPLLQYDAQTEPGAPAYLAEDLPTSRPYSAPHYPKPAPANVNSEQSTTSARAVAAPPAATSPNTRGYSLPAPGHPQYAAPVANPQGGAPTYGPSGYAPVQRSPHAYRPAMAYPPGASYAPAYANPIAGHYGRQPPAWFNPGTYQEPREPTPDQILRTGIDELSRFLQSDAAENPDALQAYVLTRVAPYFDFTRMARWAAGRYFRRMDANQRSAFTQKLAGMFLEALTRNLGTYTNPLPRIDIFHLRSARFGDEVTVRALVTPRGGYPMKLDFGLARTEDGQWRVYDVAANGNSAVTYYRNHFARLASRQGIPALLR